MPSVEGRCRSCCTLGVIHGVDNVVSYARIGVYDWARPCLYDGFLQLKIDPYIRNLNIVRGMHTVAPRVVHLVPGQGFLTTMLGRGIQLLVFNS